MSHILAGRLDDLPSDIRHHLGAFRHKVFVQRLHWEIPGVSHDATSEWDEFDGGSTVHLVALSADEEVCGCARLMPTTGRYLLRDVFPELTGPGSLISSPSIWELSRFAASGLADPRTGLNSGMSLLPYAMALARSFDAKRLIGVVSRPVARLYRRFGLDLRDIGARTAPSTVDIVACSIDVEAATFHKLRCDPVTLLDSITRFGQLSSPHTGLSFDSRRTDAGAHSPYTNGDEPLTASGSETMRAQATIRTTGV
ncbi:MULTISPECIES: acyl-homoserine-lactone synthase [Paraburkholderia]|jgi:acyl homoserine lactone synthase|uniref:Acyl-homoserine-lactone synthase n=1 Tax=Paraburkholderia fungorum TaxID=134537 RepID=A0AAP5USW7_9BURK|nr:MULTISPECIES: acyl-homoserine-lactone synthase [Paraburkholderia]MBB4515394.1 acyl homoserine lactone synthase [Paraburkholderia fungorum]MBB6203337.1 acyl homoserine lactone synthase [Paraburkholderia fungorum]MDE1011673.1 GNAT family N-acetyltransferase [Paraburkholderia fungorum]MDT8835902.1 GNAT family N-acetyltransferase [Paraburkholderia fungorum]PNE56899.1 GNAT family N-acetyltransferase [Paraburkholderia fungorum]